MEQTQSFQLLLLMVVAVGKASQTVQMAVVVLVHIELTPLEQVQQIKDAMEHKV
jgi:uncharacterized membrane protein (DUF441 family)